MTFNKTILILFSSFFHLLLFSQEKIEIHGKITDETGKAVELANVSVVGKTYGTSSDEKGWFEFKVPYSEELKIGFSCLGYKNKTLSVKINNEDYKKGFVKLSVVLIKTYEEISEVQIHDKLNRTTSFTRLDPKVMNIIPNVTGSIEALLKTLPGVSSSNELSSQYSVRGGNFDENLVYVNDIEIFRPFLIRSGRQEGLSFVNSDLVSSVIFSAGGFDAKYGDKMSSVLDIKYKKPTKFSASASASLLGASAHVEGTSSNHRFTHITGFRYKSSQYILNSLETKGEYDPSFTDFQTYLTYDVSDNFELGFLGNSAINQYKFIPVDRETSFGTVHEALQLKMYFDGQEVDKFSTLLGAISGDYKPNKNMSLKFVASGFYTSEKETFDIQSQYLLNELDKDLGSETHGDSIANIGIGTFLNHARNYLDFKVYNAYHKGHLILNNNNLIWGLKYQHEKIEDDINEWMMLDSAGFSLPYTDSIVSFKDLLMTDTVIHSNRMSIYVQNTYSFNFDSIRCSITGGIRTSYWDFNNRVLFSPRASFSLIPNWKRDVLFRFSSGFYYQPPFYKELRNQDGEINKNIEEQKSIHFVLSGDYQFMAWNRPFKLVSELYYKFLDNLIPYNIDNVRIRYYGKNNAHGYSMGIDIKINGEFVKGVDSWLSVSVMQTEEDIEDDYYDVTDSNGTKTIFPGYIPRPSDQRVNVGLFFQDYFPGNPSYKMHLNLLFGSRLPFGPPDSERYEAIHRMPPYRRVDIGFSKIIMKQGINISNTNIFRYFKNLWLGLEVYNLFGVNNTISYLWVTDVENRQYAVPNNLSARRLNFKIISEF
ncbi:MAG: TonB-dependent receptor [Bacteroidales bacterium]|nr:TonB-dependent receptor [Bacteroidales bacterium]